MSIQYAILGLLARKDLHGYRIKQVIERDFGSMWTVNYGQIYPALRKMREEGLVTMAEVPRPDAPPRKLYSITDEGRRRFAAWLAAGPERRVILRDPFLLRFPFFDAADRETAIERVDEQIDVYQNEIDERRAFLARRGRGGECARLVSELGLELNETMLRWLRRAREELATARDEEAAPRARRLRAVHDGTES